LEQGETLICRLDKGGKIEVTLEDRVYPDRSCGQYEAGWWVYADYKDYPNNFIEYFLSESGILYTWDVNEAPQDRGYTVACGYSVMLKRRLRDLEQAEDAMIEALKDDPDWSCGFEA
jgi:hypothetical protein